MMKQTIDQHKQVYTSVFETQSILLASAVCDDLEKAGIPARLNKNGSYKVEVPARLQAETRQLLYRETIINETL
jgi:hypothetical protein